MKNLDIILEELDFDKKAIGDRIKSYGNNLDPKEQLRENRMRFLAWRDKVDNKE